MWISKKDYEKIKALAEGRKHNLKDLSKQIARQKHHIKTLKRFNIRLWCKYLTALGFGEK